MTAGEMLVLPDKASENPVRMLVCVSDSDHARVAVRYASLRLKHRGGRLDLLHVLEPADFQSLSMIADRIQDENRASGEALLQSMAEEVRRWADATPTLVLKEGKIVEQILAALEENPEISLLILGTSLSGSGRREVATELVQQLGKRVFVPLLLVPGHLTDQQIHELT